MKKFFVAATVALGVAGLSLAACGGATTCDKAADAIKSCPAYEEPTDGETDGEADECTETDACNAQCVIDHKDFMCDLLDDPMGVDADAAAAFTECTDAC